MKAKRYILWLALLVGLGAMPSAREGCAQTPADFYAGRTVDLFVGFSPGGAYDTYARLIARFMSGHLAGHPTFVLRNMAGAGSLTLANFLYNAAPKDGTAIGTFSRGMITEPLLGSAPRFDPVKFVWLGSVAAETSLCAARSTSPVQSWEDMLQREFVVGGTGSGADTDIFVPLLKNMFGAKLKLITGYPGGNELNLAMERREIDGRCGWTWSAIKSTSMSWVTDRKLKLLVQLGLDKNPELADVPWIMDLTTDERQRQILKLVLARLAVAWPFVAPPDVPADRSAALRQAFVETVRDPAFLVAAKQSGLTVSPLDGPTIDALIGELYRIPRDVAQAARAAAGLGAQ